ncbi:MAG: DUF981 family protein [Planctomycetota bacterium]
MFIDYVTLMLVNMAAGYAILAYFLLRGLGADDPRRYVPGFAASGLVATACGLHMCWTWPLPGPYNSAFGEMSVLLGVLFLTAALTLWRDWKLHTLAIYGWFAGVAAVIVGIRFIGLGLSQTPVLAGVGFILSGLPGVLLGVVIAMRKHRFARALVAAVAFAAALIWAYIGYKAIWMHMQTFGDWQPPTMQ